jgi:maltooligosyltrehalose synthase
VIAAPVQVATLTRGALVAPIGQDVWRENALLVPGEAGRVYRELFTGRALTTNSTAQSGRASLKLGDVFGAFPVAALLAD